MAGAQLWGLDTTNKIWIPLQVDSSGRLKVDMSNINLGDLGNVDLTGLADDDFLYYDQASGLWKPRKLVDADIPASIARDTEVTAAVAAEAALRATGDSDEATARAAADAAHAALTTGIHGLKGEVSFEVCRILNQSIPDVTNTKVEYNTVVEDTHSYWDATNYRHVPQIAGKYLYISCTQLYQVADAAIIYVMLFKNGVFYSFVGRFRAGGISSLAVQGSKVVAMNGSTDYMEVWVYHAHGSARNLYGGSERNWFQGILLAQT